MNKRIMLFVEAFLTNKYVEIMTEVKRVTDEHGVTMKDVLLELNFMWTAANGPGPALKDDFNVDTLERYTAGDRPAKPDWDNVPVDAFLTECKTTRNVVNSHLSGFARNLDGSINLFAAPLTLAWTDEALACFPLEEGDNLDRFLSTVNWRELVLPTIYGFAGPFRRAAQEKGL